MTDSKGPGKEAIRKIELHLLEIWKKFVKIKEKRRKNKNIFSPVKRCFDLDSRKECQDICNSMIIKFMTFDNLELCKMLFMIDFKIFSGMSRYSMHPHRFEKAKNRCRFYEKYTKRFNSFIL
jgi:hypothetical protein